MRRAFVIFVLLIVGCAAQSPVPPKPAGLSAAVANNAGLSEDLATLGRTMPEIKKHADPVGQALTDSASSTVTAAQGKASETSASLDQARADAQKSADALAAANAKLAKAVADKHSTLNIFLYAIIGLGTVLIPIGWVLYLYTKQQFNEYIALLGLGLDISSISVTVVINLLDIITPVFAWTVCGLLIAAAVAIFIAVLIECLKNKQTVVAGGMTIMGGFAQALSTPVNKPSTGTASVAVLPTPAKSSGTIA